MEGEQLGKVRLLLLVVGGRMMWVKVARAGVVCRWS